MEHTYLKLRQIRSLLGEKVPFSTLREWVHSVRLAGFYAGGRIVVREKDLMDFLKPVPVGKKEPG